MQYYTKWLEIEQMKQGRIFLSECTLMVEVIPLMVTAKAVYQISGIPMRMMKVHHKEDEEEMALQDKTQDKVP